MLPTSSQKGLSRVGHERPLNTNSCADQPTNKRRGHQKVTMHDMNPAGYHILFLTMAYGIFPLMHGILSACGFRKLMYGIWWISAAL